MVNLKKRVGIYAWVGPGTIRLLQTKYHAPKIDSDSFLQLYEAGTLKRLKEIFGVTDAWVTYSWGFADQTEKIDRQFVVDRLKNFAKVKIATHAYIQGFNLVTTEFPNQDLFCKDTTGHLLPYSKGRSFTCPNNPTATKIILDRVKAACQENFVGIFIDNLVFGLPPVNVSRKFTPFFGCACQFCQEKFFKDFGYELPFAGLNELQLQNFLEFRSASVAQVIQKAFQITQKYQKELGVNLYDPYLHTPEIYFGFSLKKLAPYLSYYLIENHAHPAKVKSGNLHLQPLLEQAVAEQKPVFVVSYKKGIGFEKQFEQSDLDRVVSEATQLGYSPCYKITEFTTKRIWHALYLNQLHMPMTSPVVFQRPTLRARRKYRQHEFMFRKLSKMKQRYLARILYFTYEQPRADWLIRQTGLYQKQLWSVKKTDI